MTRLFSTVQRRVTPRRSCLPSGTCEARSRSASRTYGCYLRYFVVEPRRLVLLAVVLGSVFGAAKGSYAQSALKALEEKIRGQVRPQQREPIPPPVGMEETGPVRPVPQPVPKTGRESGYLGLVADNREDGQPGVRILEVTPGGPADRAGLRAGDLIAGLGGVRIRELSEMAAIIEHVPPDGAIEFEVIREGRPQTLRVVFGRRGRSGQAELPPVEPASEPPPQDLESLVKRLERRLEQLEQRVLLLERRMTQAPQEE